MDRRQLTTSCIHRLHVDHALSAGIPDPASATAHLAAATGQPLREALTRAFASAEAGDPDAVWVIRELEVRSTIPRSLDNPDAIAERLAAAVHRAVLRAVASGPQLSERFPDRAAYVAAFVRAVLDGNDHSWRFRRLAAARGLAVVDALVVAARLLEAAPLAVVAACAASDTWGFVVRRAAPADVHHLADWLRAAVPGSTATTEQRHRVDELTLGVVVRRGRGATGEADRLVVLGRVLAESGVVAWAVAAALGGPAGAAVEPGGIAAAAAALAPDGRPGPVAPAPVADHRVTVSGAAALLLVTSVPAVAHMTGLQWLAEVDEVGLAVRAELLSRVLGVDRNDPGVLLAAGWPGFPTPDDIAPAVDQDGLRAVGSAVQAHLVPDVDREWLGGGPDALVQLADVVGRHFTSRLVGFHTTPYEYLVPRLFGPAGVVTLDDVSITVELDAPPLLVVLQLAGLADFVTALPWRREALIVRHEGRA